jgi:hypothetical protein
MVDKDDGKNGVVVILEKEFKKAQEKEDHAKAIIPDLIKLRDDSYKSDRSSLIYCIQMGVILLKGKVLLGSEFKKLIITSKVLPAKQCQRYIKLVLDLKSETKFGTCKTSEDFAALTVDDRVVSLTEKGIAKLTDPTQAKLLRMKRIKQDFRFQEVVNGNDSVFDNSDNLESATTTTKKVDLTKMPKGMDEGEFKKLAVRNVYDVIEQLHKEQEKNKAQQAQAKKNAKAATKQRLAVETEREEKESERKLRIEAEEKLKNLQLQDLTSAAANQPEDGQIGANEKN